MRVQQPWVEGEAYEVALLTSTGGTIAHEIPVAVETPASDLSFFGLMALLGIYVGVIPVALGMLWLPWIRRIPPSWLRVRDGADGRPARVPGDRRDARGLRAGRRGLAGVRRRGARADRRRGRLPAADGRVGVARRRGARGASGGTLALLVATGIGLHNLGEGVAIGSAYAVGALALGAFLVVGFALHNTTEGLAIVAPIAHLRPSLRAAGAARPDRRRAGGARARGSAPPRSTRSLAAFLFGFGAGRDRAGDRPARAVAARRQRPHAASGRRRRAAGGARADVRDRAAGERLMHSTEAVENYAKAIYALQRRAQRRCRLDQRPRRPARRHRRRRPRG